MLDNRKIVTIDNNNLHILRNLTIGYEAEFSSLTGKLPNENGELFLDTIVGDLYDGTLFYLQNIPIGFCIYNVKTSPHEITEFYILPAVRNKKLGRHFAKKIICKYAGNWVIKQIAGADKAVKFWQDTINEISDNAVCETIIDDYWGIVTKQSFYVE